jgi:hypothetical protein
MALYPELYRHGYGGGFGSAPDNPFWIPNVTFFGTNVTVRDILAGIAEANGNAAWVVELTHDELSGSRPKWEGMPINKMGHSPLNYRWRFIPLEGAVY